MVRPERNARFFSRGFYRSFHHVEGKAILSIRAVVCKRSFMRQNALLANDFDRERIRCSPNTRVVVHIGCAQELRQKTFDLGASACVTKSAPMEELLAKVKKLAATSLTMTGSESQPAVTGLTGLASGA